MKKYLSLVLVLIILCSLVSCSSNPKTFEIADAEKLTVFSGSTGKSIDITDSDHIKYITDNITALKYSKGGKVNADGFTYSLQWYDINGTLIESLTLFGDGYTIAYDGRYYKGMSADYEIDLPFIESLFAE